MTNQQTPKLSRSARRRRNKRLRHEAELQNADYKLHPPETVEKTVHVGNSIAQITPEDAAEILVKSGLKDRDIPVLDAICGNMGITYAEYIIRVVRSDVIKHKPAYREAMGAGGNSSKNIEFLADKLEGK